MGQISGSRVLFNYRISLWRVLRLRRFFFFAEMGYVILIGPPLSMGWSNRLGPLLNHSLPSFGIALKYFRTIFASPGRQGQAVPASREADQDREPGLRAVLEGGYYPLPPSCSGGRGGRVLCPGVSISQLSTGQPSLGPRIPFERGCENEGKFGFIVSALSFPNIAEYKLI